tara:strand:- start:2690 stop:3778 length:1089 start_codon:yes stop_codon:yes gene_type:complete
MKKILLFGIAITFLSCEKDNPELENECSTEGNNIHNKINGASILQTWKLFHSTNTAPENIIHTTDLAQKTNANWVSLSPVIEIEDRSNQDTPYVYRFPVHAEMKKMRVIIPKMSNSGLNKIMIKPLTSFYNINGSRFWGDFFVETEEEWQEVERAYTELFYNFAKLHEEFPEVILLSIGTEIKEFSSRRLQFFKGLIAKIRMDFPGLKLTYASNWDEYQSISFWDDLDYIGVNPYFPLVNEKNPTFDEIKQAFVPIKNDLITLSCSYNIPILFTEYGYRSIDFASWKAWLLEDISSVNFNFEAQNNGYRAFFDTFWNENWVAGGFFWEWKIISNGEINNPNENGWYVNDKPVEKIIHDRYSN